MNVSSNFAFSENSLSNTSIPSASRISSKKTQHSSSFSHKDSLKQSLMKIIHSSHEKIGLSILHFPSGFSLSFNEREFFPMASTVKVPLAIYCLTKVDQKQLSLDEQILIHDYDIRDGSGILKKQADAQKRTVSLAKLIQLMMEHSDNTATDLILKRCGGPYQGKQWLEKIGCSEISITQSCLSILGASCGIKNLPQDGHCTLSQFHQLQKLVSAKDKHYASTHFVDYCPDRATPRSMCLLLHKLMTTDLLQLSSRSFLLQAMSHCKTGPERIRKLLPAHTFVADKTGTLGALTADVAIVALPENKGHIIITVYVQGTQKNLIKHERIIAEISQVVFRSFTRN